MSARSLVQLNLYPVLLCLTPLRHDLPHPHPLCLQGQQTSPLSLPNARRLVMRFVALPTAGTPLITHERRQPMMVVLVSACACFVLPMLDIGVYRGALLSVVVGKRVFAGLQVAE